MPELNSFTGRHRKRVTKKSVKAVDGLARIIISLGGVGTIVAVLGVCLFLLWVVVPLFQDVSVEEGTAIPAGPADMEEGGPLHLGMDANQNLGWQLRPDGFLEIFRFDTGEVITCKQPFPDQVITAVSFRVRRPEAMIGFKDGSFALVKMEIRTEFLPEEEITPEAMAALEEQGHESGHLAALGEGIVEITPEGQYKKQWLTLETIKSKKVSDAPVLLVDHVITGRGLKACVLTGDKENQSLSWMSGREKENFMTGETSFSLGRARALPFESRRNGPPRYLALTGTGDDVFIAWEDGFLMRTRVDDPEKAFVAEKGYLIERSGQEGAATTLTSMEFILGGNTLLWGDSLGNVQGGFLLRFQGFSGQGLHSVIRDEERSRFVLAITKDLGRAPSRLTAMIPSGRSRLALCGFADGGLRLIDVTSEQILLDRPGPSEEPVKRLAFAPREDGFMVAAAGRLYHYRMDPKHTEANMSSLFRPVWYEGYDGPEHMWQSSSASDDAEPKLGMMPLVFGTLKATLYAMLFGAPLALLAALYSSEFLHPRSRARVKPAIELMASLPSVVLGFLGGLVMAPFVEKTVPFVLLLFVSIPFTLLLAAHIWQLLPDHFTRPLGKWRLFLAAIPILLGILLALVGGPLMEKALFAGDIKGWLAWSPDRSGDAAFASALGGWLLLTFPLCAFAVYLLVPTLAVLQVRTRAALAIRFLGLSLATVLSAFVLAFLLDALGADPRSDWVLGFTDFSPLDLYEQRNVLIVGFVMGFAIIPIIYTLADDALAAVPEHLRSASLGCGATKWQTAVRIVMPTAMSGLFSALMVGLGRAVGETMIVLMALGGTAVMDMNLFNGARTLSANIATELPEAVRDSTHYRTLFLAALVLFAMTFVVNTAAEAVRLRFRRRAVQL